MKECLRYFANLGLLGFGGPLAILAQLQKDLVHDRKWMDPKEFEKILSFLKSMPGPIAFQAVVFLAAHRAGLWAGLFSGLLFVLPSFLMMIAAASIESWAPSGSFGQVTEAFLVGAQLAALALIFLGLVQLSESRLKRKKFIFLCLGSAVLFYFSWPEPLIILNFGMISVLLDKLHKPQLQLKEMSLLALAVICLQAGALSFGSGLAIIPLLESDFVPVLGHGEFLKALAWGQMTPGPVVITVTYLGFKLHGVWGATLATVCMFGPGMIHMLTWFPRVQKKLGSLTWIGAFVEGALAAIVVGMAVALWKLSSHFMWQQLLLSAAAFLIVRYFKIAGVWVVVSGGLCAVLWQKLSIFW